MDDNGNSEKDVHLTVRVSNRLNREIDEWSEQRGYSRSEAARKLLKQGLDYEDKIGEIEDRIQELEIDVQQNANSISKLESADGEPSYIDSSIGATGKNDFDQDNIHRDHGP